jgi:MEMO1 family protein
MRDPVVAGTFYPALPAQLRTAVERLLVREREPRDVPAVIVPHAGYLYSGPTAGKTYASTRLPDRLVLLGPNHTGAGAALSVMAAGVWRTPLGEVSVDEPLAGELLQACPGCRADADAHAREHALEVQLPFLQVMHETFTILPVTVGTYGREDLFSLGHALAQMMERHPGEIGLVVSSDMNHYESAATNRKKDGKALEAVLALDAHALLDTVRRENVSMCGAAPAAAALHALKTLGVNRAELVDYTHSGLVTGDSSEVVSYAGVRFWKEGV